MNLPAIPRLLRSFLAARILLWSLVVGLLCGWVLARSLSAQAPESAGVAPSASSHQDPQGPATTTSANQPGPDGSWFTVTAGTEDVSSTAMAQVRTAAKRAVGVLQKDFPSLPRRSFRIFVHDRRAAMPAWLQAMHHEGSPGFALLARHEIHLVHSEVAGSGKGFWPVVLHELTHEFLEQHTAPNGRYLPRWFHEGMAQVIAGDIYLGATEDSLLYRIAARRLFSFWDISERFPSEPAERQAAYAQSYSFVSWLENKYSRSLLLECAGMVARDTTIERALVLETQRNTEELLQGWRNYLLHGSGAPWRVLLDQCFSLSIIFALPLLALAMRRSLRRDKRARMLNEQSRPARVLSEFHGPPLPPHWPDWPDPHGEAGPRPDDFRRG